MCSRLAKTFAQVVARVDALCELDQREVRGVEGLRRKLGRRRLEGLRVVAGELLHEGSLAAREVVSRKDGLLQVLAREAHEVGRIPTGGA
jgi:hypothetical protein